MKILIIEDSAETANLEKTILEKEGNQVLISKTAKKGIQKAKKINPDLILLDNNLPGMQGTEACKKLKQNPQTADITIIMLTSDTKIEDIEFALYKGADAYITKPFDADTLWDKIQRKLKNI